MPSSGALSNSAATFPFLDMPATKEELAAAYIVGLEAESMTEEKEKEKEKEKKKKDRKEEGEGKLSNGGSFRKLKSDARHFDIFSEDMSSSESNAEESGDEAQPSWVQRLWKRGSGKKATSDRSHPKEESPEQSGTGKAYYVVVDNNVAKGGQVDGIYTVEAMNVFLDRMKTEKGANSRKVSG